METLLTPLVNRLLDKFVKKSQEGNAPKFKASLSGVRGFVLHNLELDLASVIPAALLVSHRAFARSLKIRIPWTGLNTQPIEVRHQSFTSIHLFFVAATVIANRRCTHRWSWTPWKSFSAMPQIKNSPQKNP